MKFHVCHKAAPTENNTIGSKPDCSMISGAKLKGDETLVAHLYAHVPGKSMRAMAYIFRQPDGEIIVIEFRGGGWSGGYRRANTRDAAGILKRFASRATLKKGQRVEAQICVEEPNPETARGFEYVKDSEPCTFVEFADADKNVAVVIRPDGSRARTAVFEPYRFLEGEHVWARIAERWVAADVVKIERNGDIEVNFAVHNKAGELQRWARQTVSVRDLRAAEESVPARERELVKACIGGRWFENCTVISGTVGGYRVRTRFFQRKMATMVRPMRTAADEQMLKAA